MQVVWINNSTGIGNWLETNVGLERNVETNKLIKQNKQTNTNTRSPQINRERGHFDKKQTNKQKQKNRHNSGQYRPISIIPF